MKKSVNQYLYDYLFNQKKLLNYEDFAKELRLNALAGRVCYDNSSIQEILEKDERVNGDKYLDYLKRLSSKGHTSIFSHNIVIKDLDKIIKGDKLQFSFNELIGIDENINYLLEFLTHYEQLFPTFSNEVHIERSKKAFITLLKMVLRFYMKGIPYTPDTSDLTVNFRTILELAKEIDKEDYLWSQLEKIEAPIIEIKETYLLNTGGHLHILEYDNVAGNQRITFILEGVSRVLTHQLVRHKLDVEYSQRSHRYTKIKANLKEIDEVFNYFVIPNLTYIKNVELREKFLELIKLEYLNELQVYNELITKDKKSEMVKAEDARYIIGDGIRTIIMVSFYSKETIDNFINLRADEHAQWEIREIAEKLNEFRNRIFENGNQTK